MSNRESYPAAFTPLTGDVTAGAGATATVVTGIQTYPVAATTPLDQQVLKFTADATQPHGGTWAPATPATYGTLQVNGVLASDDYEVAVNGISCWFDGIEAFEVNGVFPLPLTGPSVPGPDMGAGLPIVTSPRSGYARTYVTDKFLESCVIGQQGNPQTGGVRYNPVSQALEAFINGAWRGIANATFREDPPDGYALEHLPFGFTVWLNVTTGNSDDNLALNGLPFTRNNKVCMGSNPFPITISGGSF